MPSTTCEEFFETHPDAREKILTPRLNSRPFQYFMEINHKSVEKHEQERAEREEENIRIQLRENRPVPNTHE